MQELSGQRSDTISKLVPNIAVMMYCNFWEGPKKFNQAKLLKVEIFTTSLRAPF